MAETAGAVRPGAQDAWPERGRELLLGAYYAVMQPLYRRLGVDITSEVGARAGMGFARVVRGYPSGLAQRSAEANWRRLRPQDTPERVGQELQRMWRHFGRLAAEFFVLDRFVPEGRVELLGAEHVSAAMAEGRPILFVAPHLGNWEAIWPALAALGPRINYIYQPPSNRADHGLARRMRRLAMATANGQDYPFGIPAWPDGARKLVRTLTSGDRVAGLHIDEFMHGEVHAPLFGRPPQTRGNLARAIRLARLADAVILPVYALRTTGARFKVVVLPALPQGKGPVVGADVSALNDVIEPIVLENLGQWFWLPHLRWSPGEAAPSFPLTGRLAEGPADI